MEEQKIPALLITGAIQINPNVPFVTITDSGIRLKEYLDTVTWAIESTKFDLIIFCENTGYRLEDWEICLKAEKRGKQFEYLTFHGDDDSIQKKGKGYGEGEIIAYALKNSRLLKERGFFCKLTGRITIKNIDRLIHKNRNYFMHVEGESKIDTRFYCVHAKDYIRVLSDTYKHVNDTKSWYLENAFYKEITGHRLMYRAFYEVPYFVGISGSTGRSYERKRSRKAIILTNFLCRLNLYNSSKIWLLIHTVSKVKNKMGILNCL